MYFRFVCLGKDYTVILIYLRAGCCYFRHQNVFMNWLRFSSSPKMYLQARWCYRPHQDVSVTSRLQNILLANAQSLTIFGVMPKFTSVISRMCHQYVLRPSDFFRIIRDFTDNHNTMVINIPTSNTHQMATVCKVSFFLFDSCLFTFFRKSWPSWKSEVVHSEFFLSTDAALCA